MTHQVPEEPPVDVPEADWAEQHLEAGPPLDDEPDEQPPVMLSSGLLEANEADVVEQQMTAYSDIDEP